MGEQEGSVFFLMHFLSLHVKNKSLKTTYLVDTCLYKNRDNNSNLFLNDCRFLLVYLLWSRKRMRTKEEQILVVRNQEWGKNGFQNNASIPEFLYVNETGRVSFF